MSINETLTPQQRSFENLIAIDDYGRKVPVCNVKKDKKIYVGVFYSAWLGYHMQRDESGDGDRIYCVDHLERLGDDSPLYKADHKDSPTNYFHFASEPLYGFYSMRDPWVVDRHIELLTLSGIDYLMFDTTNARIYTEAVDLVIRTLFKYKNQGWKVPKVAFYTNTMTRATITQLYDTFYIGKPEYNDIWLRFAGDDRPVIVGFSEQNCGCSDQYKECDVVCTDSDLYKYFNFFESQWPSMRRNEKKGFPWMMTWDCEPFPNENGNMAVSVIQHSWISVFASSKYNTGSRGYYGVDNVLPEGKNSDWRRGDNLEWQINAAREWAELGKVKNLLITGWNEWMAIKNPWGSPSFGGKEVNDAHTGKPIYFVDAYNAEYSRDMEMGKEYGDSFYMQLLRHAREIKYGKKEELKREIKTVNDITDLSIWDSVETEYADFVGDAMARDGENAIRVPHSYIDNSNRNDITSIKIVEDDKYLCFMVKTLSPVTEYKQDDLGWMNILISTTDNDDNFMGFNYVINRKPNANGKTTVEKCVANGEYKWKEVGECEYFVKDNAIVYKIPLKALNMESGASFSFKVTDNVLNPEDKMSYYIYGDSAPIGRMAFAYNLK